MPEIKVTFNRNVKYGTDLYRKGDSASIPSDDCDELLSLGVINDDFERPVEKKSKAKSKEG